MGLHGKLCRAPDMTRSLSAETGSRSRVVCRGRRSQKSSLFDVREDLFALFFGELRRCLDVSSRLAQIVKECPGVDLVNLRLWPTNPGNGVGKLFANSAPPCTFVHHVPESGSMQDAGCGGRSTASDRPCDDRAIRAAAVAGHGERRRSSRDRWRFRVASRRSAISPNRPAVKRPTAARQAWPSLAAGMRQPPPSAPSSGEEFAAGLCLNQADFGIWNHLGKQRSNSQPRLSQSFRESEQCPSISQLIQMLGRMRAFSVRFGRPAPRQSGVPDSLSESVPELRGRESSAGPALHRECSPALHPKPSSRGPDPAPSSSRQAFVHRTDRSRVAPEPCPWEPATPERRSPTTCGEPSRATRPRSPGDFPGRESR